MSWAAKVGKGSTSTPHLNNLPPTTEAFIEHVKRAHIQIVYENMHYIQQHH